MKYFKFAIALLTYLCITTNSGAVESPFVGPADAPVTLVVFTDFE